MDSTEYQNNSIEQTNNSSGIKKTVSSSKISNSSNKRKYTRISLMERIFIIQDEVYKHFDYLNEDNWIFVSWNSADSMFKAADWNRDGTISKNEIKKWFITRFDGDQPHSGLQSILDQIINKQIPDNQDIDTDTFFELSNYLIQVIKMYKQFKQFGDDMQMDTQNINKYHLIKIMFNTNKSIFESSLGKNDQISCFDFIYSFLKIIDVAIQYRKFKNLNYKQQIYHIDINLEIDEEKVFQIFKLNSFINQEEQLDQNKDQINQFKLNYNQKIDSNDFSFMKLNENDLKNAEIKNIRNNSNQRRSVMHSLKDEHDNYRSNQSESFKNKEDELKQINELKNEIFCLKENNQKKIIIFGCCYQFRKHDLSHLNEKIQNTNTKNCGCQLN